LHRHITRPSSTAAKWTPRSRPGPLAGRVTLGVLIAGGGGWDGPWHHVVGTFDGDSVRFSIVGGQVSGSPASVTPRDSPAGGTSAPVGKPTEAASSPVLDWRDSGPA
jgi:hypothetical protein